VIGRHTIMDEHCKSLVVINGDLNEVGNKSRAICMIKRLKDCPKTKLKFIITPHCWRVGKSGEKI
jgi:hypothetical protein